MRRYALHALLLFFLALLPLSLSQLSASDRAAMAAIAQAIKNQTSKWNTSHPDPCKWSGVVCSPNAVTTLTLSSLQLSNSSVLPLLCSLHTLRHLNLSNNQLPFIPLAFFANCSAAATFQSLNFSSNILRGPLPAFSGFSSLESLDLSNNFLVGNVTTQLDGLTALRNLNLSRNAFVGTVPTRLGTGMLLEELQLSKNLFIGAIPDDVGDYRNLTLIDLSSNNITGRIPHRLLELPKLEILVLSSNSLVDAIPPGLSRITTLSRFAANENMLFGSIPAEISNHVKFLDLSYNNLTGLIPPSLLRGRNLVFVDLTSNALEGPIPVDMSPSLFRLRLGRNRLNGSIPSSIGKVSRLMYFEAGSNGLSGEIPAELAECKNLSLLDLSENKLHGRLPNEIGNLTELVVLRLDGNQLTGEIPEFTQVKNLSILSLGRNSLTGAIPGAITKLTKLSNLNLESNLLNGQIPDGFVSMKVLLEVQLGANLLNGTIPRMPETLQIAINLSRNHFEGPLSANLSSLVNLEILDLSNNRFSGEIPIFLTQLSSLTQLDLSNNRFSGTVPQFRTNLNLKIEGNDVRTTKPAEVARKRKNVATVVTVVVVVVVGAVAAMVTLAAIFIISRRFYRVNDEISELEEAGPQVINGHMITTESIHRSSIDFAKAIEAAGNPANAMYKSRFSTYYKAVMPSGISYCIKKLNWSDKIFQLGSHERFGQEVEALGRLNNSRIMVPIAYVLTADSAYLFYDHVQKGTVFDFLHKNLGGATLDWQSRYNIALGVAQGITFLHGCGDPILLLDLSTKTIVLKSENEPQIADIELSKVIDPSKSTGSLSTVAGSVGYIPPEYAYTMRVTMAGNIYSFGVVLLELLTGKPSVSEGTELTKWVMSNSTRNDAREQILDPTISKTSLAVRSRMLSVLKIAQACVSISPEARPKIKNVVRMLLHAR